MKNALLVLLFFILHPSSFILEFWEARPRSPLRLRAPLVSAAAKLPILVVASPSACDYVLPNICSWQ
jgi:hypothetical protein